MIRKKSILKDSIRKILLNKKAFICLLLVIIIGNGVCVGLKVTSKAMEKNARDYYAKTNLFDLKITSTIGFSNGDKYTLKQINGVNGINFVKTLIVSTNINNKDYIVKLNSISSDRSLKSENYINRLTLTSGKYPSTINEGLVEESFLQDNNLKLGDLVTLNPDNSEDLRAKKIKIVGTVKSSYYSSKNKGLTNDASKKIDYVMFLEENDFNNSTYSEIFITIKDAKKYNTYKKKYEAIINKYKKVINEKVLEITKASYESNISALNSEIINLEKELNELNQTDLPIESLGDMVKDLTEKLSSKKEALSKVNNYNVQINTRDETSSFYDYKLEIEKIDSISNFFSFIFFLISNIVFLIVINKIIDEEEVQIGMLSAMGYGKIDIMFKYVLYSFLISFLGSIIGELLFYKIIPLLVGFAYNDFYQMPLINANLQIKNILSVALLSCIINTIITILSFINIFKKTPAELIKSKNHKKFLNKFIKLLKRISFFNKFSFKILIKYILSLNTVAISLTIALILSFFGVKDSISSTINKQFNKINKYNISLNFSGSLKDNEKNNIINKLTINKNIKDLGLFLNSSVSIENKNNLKNIHLIIPRNQKNINKFITLKSSNNKIITLNKNGVVISNKLAKILNVQKNDKIKITMNNKKTKVKIKDVTKNYIDNYVFMSPSLYKKIFNEEVNYNSIFINTKKLNTSEENDLISYISRIDGLKNIELTKDTSKNYKKMMSSLNHVIITLIVFSSFLFFLTIYNLLKVNTNKQSKVLERLKILGLYNYEVINYYLKNWSVSGIIKMIIGMIIGIILTLLIIKNISMNMLSLDFKINFSSYILTFIIAFTLIIIASSLIYLEFKKASLAKVLKD